MARKKKEDSDRIGELADQLYTLREQRLALERQVAALKAQEQHQSEQLLAQLEVEGLARASGEAGTVSVVHTTVYSVENWDAVLGWIRKRKAWDLLHRRVSSQAVAARAAEGVTVEGLSAVHLKKLSVTKAGAKKEVSR